MVRTALARGWVRGGAGVEGLEGRCLFAGEVGLSLVGHWGGAVMAVQIEGTRAYVGQGTELVLWDLSNPGAGVEIGRVQMSGRATDIAVAGGYAYVAAGVGGLEVVDVRTPSQPRVIGRYDTAGEALGVSVSGNVAAVADGNGGLALVDISQPTAPALAGQYAVGWGADVVLAGGVAYYAAGDVGVEILNVATPSAVVRLGGYDTPGSAFGVAVSGGYVYVADGYAGTLVAVDARVPGAAAAVGSLNVGSTANAVTVVGTQAFVAADAGLMVVDIGNPAAMSGVGTFSEDGGYQYGQVIAVSVAGSVAAVGDMARGLRVLDVSNPAAIGRTWGYDSTGPMGIAVTGNTLAAAEFNVGVALADISDPARPVTLSRTAALFGNVTDVAAAGTRVFVTDWLFGVKPLDITNPAAPVWMWNDGVGDLRGYTFGAPMQMDLDGEWVYMPTGSSPGAVVALNINDPASGRVYFDGQGYPSIVSAAEGAVVAADIDPVLYTASADGATTGTVALTGSAWSVEISGGFAYVSEGDVDIEIVNISNPAAPAIVGSIANTEDTMLAVSGDRLFVSGWSGNGIEMRIFDIGNAGSPVQIGQAVLVDMPQRVLAMDNRVYTTGVGGVHIYEVGMVDVVAPVVSGVQVNDGAAQRSMVKRMGVTFSEAVTLGVGAVSVKTKAGVSVAATVEVANPSGDQKTWVVGFSGTGVVGGSLGDGVYDLVVDGSKVQDLAGNAMSGNYVQRFHRLFGDSNGDGRVNLVDYRAMRVTLGKSSGQGLFNEALDYDGGGVVSVMDLGMFRRRFGARVL